MNLREVHLFASDVDVALNFYRDTLGFAARMTDDTACVFVGPSQLVFHRSPSGWHGAYHIAFNVPGAQFAEAKAWLMARVPLYRDATGADEFFFDNWNAHAAYFLDSLGNILEIIARHTLPDEGVQPFSSAGLRCLSEIGVPMPDVPQAVAQLCEAAVAQVYSGAGGTDFTAVGDEHGLLIVVRRGREWHPNTGTLAHDIPLQVVIDLPDGNVCEIALPMTDG